MLASYDTLSFLDQNRDKKLTKARFNIILSSVWSKCMTHSNITSGFRATGLYSFNPQAIPETAFAPSILSEAPAPDSEQENVPALDRPQPQAPESGDTTPSILSEVSTPDLDKENMPLIDIYQRETPKSGNSSPSTLAQISIPDILGGNITPVDCVQPTSPEEAKQSLAIASTSTGQISRDPTVHCNFHRTVYDTRSSSEESDDLPLIQLKRNDFYDLLPTPVKVQTKIPTKRRKAINYRGTAVTKDLFNKYNDEKRKPSNKRKIDQRRISVKGRNIEQKKRNLKRLQIKRKLKSYLKKVSRHQRYHTIPIELVLSCLRRRQNG